MQMQQLQLMQMQMQQLQLMQMLMQQLMQMQLRLLLHLWLLLAQELLLEPPAGWLLWLVGQRNAPSN